jgi:hypothetical protein
VYGVSYAACWLLGRESILALGVKVARGFRVEDVVVLLGGV